MGILNNILFVMRASNPEFRRGLQEAVKLLPNVPPTSGEAGRGGAFEQTGPSTLAEQRARALFAERNDLPLDFAGL